MLEADPGEGSRTDRNRQKQAGSRSGRNRDRWQDPDFQASTGFQEGSESDWDQKHDQVVTHRSRQDQVQTGRLSGRG